MVTMLSNYLKVHKTIVYKNRYYVKIVYQNINRIRFISAYILSVCQEVLLQNLFIQSCIEFIGNSFAKMIMITNR